MTAAKIMHTSPELPGCDRTSSTSIREYPSKHGGGCSQIIEKFPNRIQTFGFVYHGTNGLNQSIQSMEDPVVPLERNYGHLLAETIMGKAI